jgi:energy-coupling factor transport system permease protein
MHINLHPAVRIASLLMLAVCAQLLHARGLLLLLAALLLWLSQLGWRDFRLLLRRARWLLLSLLLIYAFATPGEFVPGLPEWLSPTYEGLHSGLLQALRLVIMLAALACLLATGSRETWISGIYALLRPLALFGVSPERFAVRLWLTLHYVENAPSGMVKKLREHHWNLDVLMNNHTQGPAQIQLGLTRINPLDGLVLLAWIPLIWWLA